MSETKWTQTDWEAAGAASRLKSEIYFNPISQQWVVRLNRDSKNTPNPNAVSGTLAGALRFLADWIEANTEAASQQTPPPRLTNNPMQIRKDG